MSIYERLGVSREINAAGTLTRLGGSLMPAEVLDAMREAARTSVDMALLQGAAARAIAGHTGAEAAIVTTGAAAALTLGTAACLCRDDVTRMERLPDTAGMPNEVIIARTHRTGYDHAIRAAGARLVEVGFNDRGTGAGVRGVEPWEIEAAIGPQTVAIAYTAMPINDPPLPEVVALAHAHDLPVLVDAAAQLPPRGNLRRFVEAGADLVCFSGGKAIRGPQSTGMLCGRRSLVASALLQMLDMDIPQGGFRAPPELFPDGPPAALPHHGVGRGFKAGKEEIVGLLIALERFVGRDEAAEMRVMEERLEAIAAAIEPLSGLVPTLRPAAVTGRGPVLEIRIDPGLAGIDAFGLAARMRAGVPPIHLGERFAAQDALLVDPVALAPEDDELIATRLRAVVDGDQ